MKTATKPITEKLAGRCRPAHDDESGFSILETAISLVLMAIVGLGAASLFFYSARNLVSAGDRELAMAVAQQRMEQLRDAPFGDASLASGTSATVIRAGRQYTVLTSITDSNVVNGEATEKTITVRVTPDSESSTWARVVSSVFGSVTLISQRSAQSIGPNRAL
jgi:Tfp pilus assembly protein PilV